VKYYFILPVILVLGLAVAQSVTVQKPIECADTQTLFQGLIGSDYKETPIWLGVESGATLPKYSLFVNEQSKSWTLIQFDEKVACVLGTGESSTRIFNGPKI
jgi:hypothetical protein